MNEYKRESKTLEGQLSDLKRKARHHDDHIQIIDAWIHQLLDEVRLMIPGSVNGNESSLSFPTALLVDDNEQFKGHLRDRSDAIRGILPKLFEMNHVTSPDVSDLQGRISKLLTEQKQHLIDLERNNTEKQDLEDQLTSATSRYMLAEKKLDRARSSVVQRMERQSGLGGQKQSGTDGGPVKREDSAVNGTVEALDNLVELEENNNKLSAVSEKQKEQLEALTVENANLSGQITEWKIKSTRFSDDDYAGTDLFKALKSQHEDVIKRVNNLEALNVQLQEEAMKLQSERTLYRSQMESETQQVVGDKETLLSTAETNLARIRSYRDELLADQAVRKAAQEQERTSLKHISDLAAAREERILALEAEMERLRVQMGGSVPSSPTIDQISPDELRSKYQVLDRQYTLLRGELESMQAAYQKAMKAGSLKVSEFTALEEKVLRLTAEKAKADQKFFGAMKSKETRESEVRTLRMQNVKSSDVVSQLKESEAASRALLANHEKQLAGLRDALTATTSNHRVSQQQEAENKLLIDGLKAQVEELKKILVQKDSNIAATSMSYRHKEQETEELKATLADTTKSLETWKARGLGNQTDEYEALRSIALCQVCRKNFKDTVIKTCGHVFCKECVEERQSSRSRKCPHCNKSFGMSDWMKITL